METTTIYVVRCECGTDMCGTDEAALIRTVQQHAKNDHDLDFSDDQVRTLIEIDLTGERDAASVTS